MKHADANPQTASDRVGFVTVWTRNAFAAAELVRIASTPGQLLSISKKSRVDRVGDWVVKRSLPYWGATPFRLTFGGRRYRNALQVADALHAAGIGVPDVAGYLEWRAAGVVWRNALITRYMDGYVTVRDYALAMQHEGVDRAEDFLAALGDAVARFYAAGVWHGDLADKNILTRDGSHFVFLDFEAVRVNHVAGRNERILNAVQLMDAFYDLWPWTTVAVLIGRLLPDNEDSRSWCTQVLAGLEDRIVSRDEFQRIALRRAEAKYGPLE